MKRIRFQGQEYILVGGAITTEEAFYNGEMGYAHLGEDGLVRRFHSIIGSKNDIEILGDADVKMSVEGIINMLTGNGWPFGSGM